MNGHQFRTHFAFNMTFTISLLLKLRNCSSKMLYNACIYIYLFYSINWGGWRCWWTEFAPEAIHNPVAIKLLVSGLLT